MLAATTAPRVLWQPAYYPEGPWWEPGRLYFVEYARSAIRVLHLEDHTVDTVWERAGSGPAAVARAPDGALWAMANDANSVVRLAADGSVDESHHDDLGHRLAAPNDLVFDSEGWMFFTTSGVFDPDAPVAGCVYVRAPSGTMTLAEAGIHYANGIALSADGGTLFVAEHLRNRVLAFDVAADRSLSGRRIHADLTALAPLPMRDPWTGPDGLASARDGTLLIAHFGAARLLLLDAAGALASTIDLPLRYPTNIALDAAEKTLYATAFSDNLPPYCGAILSLTLGEAASAQPKQAARRHHATTPQ